MKFLTYSVKNNEKSLGILVADQVYSIKALDDRLPNTMETFIENAEENLKTLKHAYVNNLPSNGLSITDIHLHAPIQHPSSIRDFMAFEDHLLNAAKTSGIKVAPQWYKIPAFYFTNHRTIHGPNEKISRPPGCKMLDYELEIAIIIGKKGKDIPVTEADDYIFGYTILNDWSARDFQLEEMSIGLGPAKGKDFATSIGPYIVTKDDLEKYRDHKGFNLTMTATVNGNETSRGNFNTIHYSFNEMIARASKGVTLYPGDIIGSGTVGTGCLLELGVDIHPWLQDGDEVTLSIDQLGSLTNIVCS